MQRSIGWFLTTLVNGKDVSYWRIQQRREVADQGPSHGTRTQAEYERNSETTSEGPASETAQEAESPYAVLGIAESASESEIKKHYRDLILRYHPDRTAGLGKELRVLAEEMAKRVTIAYSQIRAQRGFS